MGISLTSAAKSIVRSAYVGKDFDTYRTEIITALQTIYGNEVASNIVASEQGVMLIEIIAYSLSTLSWYVDRQSDETTLDDVGGARIRANAVSIARTLGYTPTAAVPATVSLTVNIDSPHDQAGGGLPARLTLEKGRKLNGPGGLTYECSAETIMEATEYTKVIEIREGESFEQSFVSDGTKNQKFNLSNFPNNKFIAQDTIEVRVGGVLWTSVNLLTYTQTDIVELDLGNDPPFVRFGDGNAGNVPVSGSEVRVLGFVTSGPDGSVAANTITSFAAPLVAGTTTVAATLTHTSPSSTGSFRESLDSIKTNAPLVFQSAQRAVTTKDVDGLINAFSGVAKGRATTPRTATADAQLQAFLIQLTNAGISSTITTNINNYWDTVLSGNCQANVIMGQILASDSTGRYVAATATLAAAVQAYLDLKVESTVKVWVVDGSVNLVSVTMSAVVKVLAAYNSDVQKASIKTSVETAIQNALLDVDYGVSLQISVLYSTIETITGVDYVSLKVTSPTSKVDTYGNVIIQDYEVITLGTLPTVTIS